MASKKDGRYCVQNGISYGKFVVISNETFLDPKLEKRTGTEKDIENLKTTFSRLGFDFEKNIHRNKTASQMLQIIIEVASSGLENYNCLAVAILTHGLDDGRIHGAGPHGDLISLESLFNPLKAQMIDDGKPKLVFIQACRGCKFDDGKPVHGIDGKGTEKKDHMRVPIEADFLYHFSTSPGYFSYRDQEGSIFIKSLCKVVTTCLEKNEEIDLMKLLTRVNREVAEGYSTYAPSEPVMHNTKQMPSIVSMLRNEVYFPTHSKGLKKSGLKTLIFRR